MNRLTFGGVDYAPTADFGLLLNAYNAGLEKGLNLKAGNVFTADQFYNDNAELEKWAQYNILAVEMETTALYTLAAKYGRRALSVLTVSDHILTGEETTAEERQTTFNEMIEVALEAVVKE
jgi:purine-nucleoside phosphorylase